MSIRADEQRKISPSPPGLILAGGRSSRMGTSKALLDIGGRSLLRHVVDRLTPQVSAIAINVGGTLPGFESMTTIEDVVSGQLGPLAGILTGMKHFAAFHARFVSAPCDSPFLPADLVARLLDAAGDDRTVALAASAGRNHPVFALWPTALAEDLEQWLAQPDNRRINAFIHRHRSVTVDFEVVGMDDGELDPFFNINTPDDLARAHTFSRALA